MADEAEEKGENAGEEPEDTLGAYEGQRNFFNERHGTGFAILPNGDMYDGVYRHGKRHGKGLYVFRNGSRYNGDYRYGWKEGVGQFIYPDGSEYEGEWKKDKKHGFGIYRYPNGDTYEGAWYKGLRDGLGVYFYKKLNIKYSGMWEKDRMHGAAEVIYPPFRYHGDWKNSLPLGKGCFTFEALSMQIGGYINIKDPEIAAGEEEGKEADAPPPEPPTETPEGAVGEKEEEQKVEPLPKGLIPVWRPKQYLPFIPELMPKEPVPKERLLTPTTTEEKPFDDDESSLLSFIDDDLEGYCLEEDLTEILHYYLDAEVRVQALYVWDQVSAEIFDPELIHIFGVESDTLKTPSQLQRELICGLGTELGDEDEVGKGHGEEDEGDDQEDDLGLL